MPVSTGVEGIRLMGRLDVYEALPEGMREYLSNHGWHFSKKLAEYATNLQRMKNADGTSHHWDHEQVKQALERNGITIEKAKGYDCMYVANMAYSDFYPKPLASEAAILQYVKAYIDDPDGYDGIALTRYYADCIGKGEPLAWEEFL